MTMMVKRRMTLTPGSGDDGNVERMMTFESDDCTTMTTTAENDDAAMQAGEISYIKPIITDIHRQGNYFLLLYVCLRSILRGGGGNGHMCFSVFPQYRTNTWSLYKIACASRKR